MTWVGSNIVPHEADLRVRLRRMAVPEDEIGDIVQDAYLRISNLDNVSHIRSGRAYFFSTARTVLLDRIRRDRIVRIDSLGTDATLVLVDGNRLSGDSLFQGSDISGIPLSVIDHIDVVTDGASAIYGSDAVAGVVNFVLKKNYTGIETNAELGTSTQGGGFEQTYSGLAGLARGNWYGMLSGEWAKNDSIDADQREFTAKATPVTTLWAPQRRTSLFARTGADFGALHLSVDGLYSDRLSTNATQDSASDPVYGDRVSTKAYSIAALAEIELGGDWKARLCLPKSVCTPASHTERTKRTSCMFRLIS